MKEAENAQISSFGSDANQTKCSTMRGSEVDLNEKIIKSISRVSVDL